jgi:segregation and condensation protein B
MPLDAVVEAILFWKGEPVAVSRLASLLKKTEDEIEAALVTLEEKLAGRGLQLVHKDGEVLLVTHPKVGPIIEILTREELVKDLGKAGLETLSIVVYQGPIARRDIDYIRGVNSNFILRNLLVRGLVEKVSDKNDQRSFLYKPTFELLSHLGLNRIEDLPEYVAYREEIAKRQQTATAEMNEADTSEKNTQETTP